MNSESASPTNSGRKTNSKWRTNLSAEGPWSSKFTYSIPLTERMIQLAAMGNDSNTIIAICREEFADIEINPIDKLQVEDYLKKNKAMIEEAKSELKDIIHSEIMVHCKEIIQVVIQGENEVMRSLAKKLDQLRSVVEDIDLTEVDENMKPVKLSVFLASLEGIERILKMMGKYAGTDDLRALATFAQKEAISAQYKAKEDNLIPNASPSMGNAKPKVHD